MEASRYEKVNSGAGKDWDVDKEHDGWIELLRPVEKTLACGDAGDGAMREWSEIVSVTEERLNLKDKGI